jgi:hypothetical protein
VSAALANGPLWLRAVVRVERSLAGSIDRATNSGQAADVLLLLSRGNRLARRASTRLSGAVVHTLSLPSHRDVQVLHAKVEQLQRMVDELTARAGEPKGRK